MYKENDEIRKKFRGYVLAVNESAKDLEFLLDNLGINIELDFSGSSFDQLESTFWEIKNNHGYPEEFGDIQDFIDLICRYLALAVMKKTNAKLIQSREKNRTFGLPALDKFGNQPWERIYPVSISENFIDLKKTNPSFPGVRNGKVLSSVLEKAIRIIKKSEKKSV